MKQQINVNIRIDKDVKKQADLLFNDFGMNFTTAVNAFIRQSLRERAIPFQIRVVDPHRDVLLAEGQKLAMSIQNDSVKDGSDDIALDEINAIIAKSRQQRRELQI